jgi:hypothetical protein
MLAEVILSQVLYSGKMLNRIPSAEHLMSSRHIANALLAEVMHLKR